MSANGISGVDVDEAHIIDDYSPHHTKVMKFDLDPTPGNGKPNFVRFGFDSPTDLSSYRYLSLRITQVFHPQANPAAPDRDFDLILDSVGGEDTVSATQLAGVLEFPVTGLGPFNNSVTKNAMRSYLIRLAEFEGVDLGAVTSVTVRFPFQGNDPTTIILDDVEFYK